MAMICEKYLNSVVSIGIYDKDNKLRYIGTGFFVYKTIDGESDKVYAFLITNKHVVKDFSIIYIKMKNKNTSKFEELKLELKENDNLFYHENDGVDLAVINLDGNEITQRNFSFHGFNIYTEAMSTSELLQEGVNQGNLIYMLGFPLELVNANQNPLCRIGCISRIDPDEINSDKSFLIDVLNFPGNSGSPVVIRPDSVGIVDSKVFNKSVLIGIVFESILSNEQLTSSLTNKPVEIRYDNTGLTRTVPVEFIREIIEKIIGD